MHEKVCFPVLLVLAALLCLSLNSIGRAELPQAVSFWRLEGNAADSGTASNKGILKGAAAIMNDPERGSCLELDGDGYVEIPSGVAELGDADFTIAAWVKTSEIGVPILSKSNGNAEWEEAEKEFYVADSGISEGPADGTVEYVGFGCDWIRGSTAVNDGKWHHVAIVWNQDEEEGYAFVDGEEGTDEVGFEAISDNEEDTVRIGFSESAHSGANFVGRIDDVAIFGAALTPEQVVELAQLPASPGKKPTKLSPAAKEQQVTLDTDPHLLGWWKFEEASGKAAEDGSTHGRKGTLEGGLSFDRDSVSGKTGKALRLDGGDGRVEITGYKGVSGTRPRTVAAWIKTTTSRGEILSWGSDDYGKMWVLGFIRGRIGVTPNGGYLYMNPETADDQWHHVAAVVEEAELPNLHDDVKLYMDGEVAEIHDIGLLDLWPVDTGTDLDVRIGRRFKGLIDDVRIYDRPLSEDEIKALFLLRSDRPLPASK